MLGTFHDFMFIIAGRYSLRISNPSPVLLWFRLVVMPCNSVQLPGEFRRALLLYLGTGIGGGYRKSSYLRGGNTEGAVEFHKPLYSYSTATLAFDPLVVGSLNERPLGSCGGVEELNM
ncbi:hypothetical protein PM082_004105 [Marasmius tenuissimus]|nr:hypothetical protein PM082_004105 [Marasmius tenuissimus]